MSLEIDTKLLKEKGANIVKLNSQLLTHMRNFNQKINSMPSSKIWVGKACETFIRHANVDYRQYIEFIHEIKIFGDSLIKLSEDLDSSIKH